MASVKNDVTGNVFSTQRALVVGGSRGLGELTAKLLAAGGADVCLTYYQGGVEAVAVADEITRHGGKASAEALDVLAPFDAGWRSPQGWQPTHLYYFATPFIFSGQRSGFSAELLASLSAYYVTGFAQLVGPLAASGLVAAFYPSTVALDEMPTDMAEYCAAKAAGEALCRLLVRRHRGLRIDCPRLPRMATDQTASLLPAGNQDPRAVMRDLLVTFASSIPQPGASARMES
jgi:NAD(P)-dependent dehydrogenase (short-subunit alcohol dehydrogenase family)